VVRAGGHIVVVGTTPDWRPLHARAGGPPVVNANQRLFHSELREQGFESHDFVVDMDYGTQQEALETFGFIHGPEAIDYILDNHTSHQESSLRVYLRTV
jgi:hypothetical protein